MRPAGVQPPTPPRVRLCLGVTGHRASHRLYAANAPAIEAAVARICDLIAEAVAASPRPFGPDSLAPIRLHSMLADGADQLLARTALDRGWELVAPLPFGRDLNCAINAAPLSVEDAKAILEGRAPVDPGASERARAIRALYDQARVFELADDDEDIAALFAEAMAKPDVVAAQGPFDADCSARVALAARLVVEQSDLLIGVWDGARTTFIGGTGHTIAQALDMGSPVIWIDPAAPGEWRVLQTPEALTMLGDLGRQPDREDTVRALVRQALAPAEPAPAHGGGGRLPGASALGATRWKPRSNPLWHLYRRVEAIFGGDRTRSPWRDLRLTYERPDQIATGSGAATLAAARGLPQADPGFAEAIGGAVLTRFAWADGISSSLSDTYRGGMMVSFVLSALAIVGGIAYLPLADSSAKWGFALFEFVLLTLILVITFLGQTRHWHRRWFETRRVAEYLRHAPLLLALGAARAPGRWPKGTHSAWPELYARHALREVGLPQVKVTPAYLRAALATLLDTHVTAQREYHHAKAKRLTTAHHNLDRLSEWMFRLAVAVVAVYLLLQIGVWLHQVDKAALKEASKAFTFLGVMLPTFGGAIAGIRYFGDFERFAAISEVTAQKLDAVHARIAQLAQAQDRNLDYGPVAEIAHAADDIVVSEIENWQAVFGGKQFTVPV